ncbi:MAG TPA: SBBP repeat-containing protein [Verrucomicrobiae bacterium]|nr:SBBP repeat-containing protein [Verrucomicrobiae bacterium]
MKTQLIHFAVGMASTLLTSNLLSSPTLTYSTYLGGTRNDGGSGIAVDAAGCTYVVGGTSSRDFPVVNPFQASNAADAETEGNAFVTKFAPDGSVVYSTYFGGPGGYFEGGFAIATDQSGNAYIAGSAAAGMAVFPTYPVTQSVQGGTDAFVAKFDPLGGLVYSKLIGGSGHEVALGIAVDGAGSAYVCGWTASTDFPTTPGAAQSTFGGFGALGTIHGIGDGFVVKLRPDGSALEYATFLGGEDEDLAQGIAVDAGGNAFVTGQTVSAHFPTNAGAFQTQPRGQEDFFVTKLNASGTAWIYSTYLGGSGHETIENLHSTPRGIAIDSDGNAYTAGATTSENYPTTANAFQRINQGAPSSCVTKLNATGSGLIYSSYFGCYNRSYAHGIAVDSAGQAYICGRTSDGLPIVNAIYPTYGLGDGGNINGYLARISVDGSKLVYSTYLATIEPNANLIARAVAVDANGTAYVTGNVGSANFVTTANAFQAGFGGGDPAYGDAFATVIASGDELPLPAPTIIAPISSTIAASSGLCTAPFRYDVRVENVTRCVEVVCNPPSGTDLTLPVGVTTFNCVAHDVTGASNSYSFTVTVVDNQRPTISCPANVVVHPPCGQSSMVVNYPAPSASDNCSDVTVTCNPPSGSLFPAGSTTVNCTARDASGNTASCSFTVTVDTSGSTFQFTGFLEPIGGADGAGGSFGDPIRTFKLKSTIPVKFTALCDGSPVLTGVHTLQAIKYSSQTTGDTPIDATPTDAATTGNQFRLSGDEWHFNLDTKATGMSAGIWLLRAMLSDGSAHSVWIQIK